MISIDSRAGSEKLFPLLRARNLPVQLTRMSYGDVKFVGSGPDSRPVTVGIEVKSLHDILHCITDGRFAGHQLPGMVQTYEQPWLLVIGNWRARRDTGLLQYLSRDFKWRDAHLGSREFMYRDLTSWLLTMQVKTGIMLATVPDYDHAALWVSTLYSWWTAGKRIGGEDLTGWETHRSHVAMNQASNEQFWGRTKQEEREALSDQRGSGARNRLIDRAALIRPTTLRMVATQLPGVGYKRSETVAQKFQTVERLVVASVDEIAEVEGVGKLGAIKIYRALHGRDPIRQVVNAAIR